MAFVKKLINETGIVLKKEFKKASDEFEYNGRTVPAQPDRWVVTVASSGNIDTTTGLDDLTILTYKVTEEEFKILKFLQKVKVSYEFSNSGNNKAVKLEII